MSRRNQVIAVVIRQYRSGLYRTCVSLEKDDIAFLSTHKDERSASKTIDLFWQAFDEGRLKTPEDVATFINSIQQTNAPQRQNHPAPPPLSPAASTERVFLPLAA
jgi:hypothetical protein